MSLWRIQGSLETENKTKPTINLTYTHNNLIILISRVYNLDSANTLICLQALFWKNLFNCFFFPSLDLSLKTYEEAKAIIILPRQNNSVISEHSRNLRNVHLEIVFPRFHSSSQFPVVLNDGIIQNLKCNWQHHC